MNLRGQKRGSILGRSFELPPVYRAIQDEIEVQNALIRASLDIAREALRNQPPDTFLGRQHYELTPLPHERE
jgi:hypothetical protein